jgi:hypothetical protein
MSDQRNPQEDLGNFNNMWEIMMCKIGSNEAKSLLGQYLIFIHEIVPFYIQEYIKYQELKERLKGIEFADEDTYCPACGISFTFGEHYCDCWLAAEIKRGT